jgi:bleomycin hydrolase
MDPRISFCNRAMVFSGVNLEGEKPNRWKVENTWGKENGKDGFFIMDDAWFDNYVYEVFVKKEFLPAELLKKYEESKLIMVDPWAVMWSEIH